METNHTTSLEETRQLLLNHPMYAAVNTPDKVRLFMKYHVFAVWDFMSLLKRLQQDVTCVTVPWLPAKSAVFARFVNDIVLGEETDEDGQGGYVSHFELYMQAMTEVGADTAPILHFIQRLQVGQSWEEALSSDDIPLFVREFVTETMNLVFQGKPHEVASSFFFGREHIIPQMFSSLVAELPESQTDSRLVYYLNRHIELDNDSHGPLAEQLLQYLCEEDATRLQEANHVAQKSLESRIRLWNGVLSELKKV